MATKSRLARIFGLNPLSFNRATKAARTAVTAQMGITPFQADEIALAVILAYLRMKDDRE